MKLDFIRGAHAVCNLSLCGIFLVILDFIRGVYAVYFRWQNDLRQIGLQNASNDDMICRILHDEMAQTI